MPWPDGSSSSCGRRACRRWQSPAGVQAPRVKFVAPELRLTLIRRDLPTVHPNDRLALAYSRCSLLSIAKTKTAGRSLHAGSDGVAGVPARGARRIDGCVGGGRSSGRRRRPSSPRSTPPTSDRRRWTSRSLVQSARASSTCSSTSPTTPPPAGDIHGAAAIPAPPGRRPPSPSAMDFDTPISRLANFELSATRRRRPPSPPRPSGAARRRRRCLGGWRRAPPRRARGRRAAR